MSEVMQENENINDPIIEDSETIAKFKDIVTNIELLKEEYLSQKPDDINTLKDLTQNEYTAFLIFCNMKYIRPTKCLYKYFPGVSSDNKISLMYDDIIVSLLSEYYIYMSTDANKVCNPIGFSYLAGCDINSLKRWESMERQRPEAYRTIKSLQNAYETSLENGAQSGKNPVGFIATLNHRFNWSSDPKTSIQVNITRDKSQIMQSVDTGLLTENP